MKSTASLEAPYGLVGLVGADSTIGTSSGSPYVAAVEEKTSRRTASLAHGAEQRHGAADVVLPVLLGLHDRLADLREGGEVQDAVEGGVQPLGGVADVALDEGGSGRDTLAEAGGEIVEDDDLVPRLQQVLGHDTADIPRATCHQVLHELATSRSR